MDPKWLRDLLALYVARSFSRASERRNITQSAFSRRIRALEDWAGAPLVKRDSVPLELSDVGKELIPLAEAIVGRLDELEEHVAAQKTNKRQFLRFAAQHCPSTIALLAHLRELYQRIPELRTHVVSDNLNECIELLNAGHCDIVICNTHPAIHLDIDDVHFETLDIGGDELVPVTATKSPRAWQFPGTELHPIPVVSYETESFLGMVVGGTLADARLHIDVRHIDSYSEALKQIVLTGFGVAWLPHSLIAEEIRRGELQILGGEQWFIEMRIVTLLRRGAQGPAMQVARTYFRDLAGFIAPVD